MHAVSLKKKRRRVTWRNVTNHAWRDRDEDENERSNTHSPRIQHNTSCTLSTIWKYLQVLQYRTVSYHNTINLVPTSHQTYRMPLCNTWSERKKQIDESRQKRKKEWYTSMIHDITYSFTKHRYIPWLPTDFARCLARCNPILNNYSFSDALLHCQLWYS